MTHNTHVTIHTEKIINFDRQFWFIREIPNCNFLLRFATYESGPNGPLSVVKHSPEGSKWTASRCQRCFLNLVRHRLSNNWMCWSEISLAQIVNFQDFGAIFTVSSHFRIHGRNESWASLADGREVYSGERNLYRKNSEENKPSCYFHFWLL